MTSVLSSDKFVDAFADVPEGWGAMAELNNMGDARIMWDPNDDSSVAIAEAAFNETTKGRKKMMAYATDETGEKTGGVITKFDKTLSRLIFVPQLVAG